MSRLNKNTKERIKEELFSKLTEEPQSVFFLAKETNRSSVLVKKLLLELTSEKKTVGCMDINYMKTFFIHDKKKPAFPKFR